jgi:hypothetical protein
MWCSRRWPWSVLMAATRVDGFDTRPARHARGLGRPCLQEARVSLGTPHRSVSEDLYHYGAGVDGFMRVDRKHVSKCVSVSVLW